jgi:hypothetical protein
MKKFLKNTVKLNKISTIKDFRFGTFPSISGSGSGYTFYPPPPLSLKFSMMIETVYHLNIF